MADLRVRRESCMWLCTTRLWLLASSPAVDPDANRAVVDIRKLRDYCLNPLHDEEKHKARVFAAASGMTGADAERLRDILLQAVTTHNADVGYRDAYGQRYVVDFLLEWRVRQAMIRCGWILEHGSDSPRLTSCYVL